jgi:hypothetical protein
VFGVHRMETTSDHLTAAEFVKRISQGEGIRSMPGRIWEVTDRDPLLELLLEKREKRPRLCYPGFNF